MLVLVSQAMNVNVSKAVQSAVLAVALFASPVTLGSGTSCASQSSNYFSVIMRCH
jgi:hypothetical protein